MARPRSFSGRLANEIDPLLTRRAMFDAYKPATDTKPLLLLGPMRQHELQPAMRQRERVEIDTKTTCGVIILGRRSNVPSYEHANDPEMLRQEAERALEVLQVMEQQGMVSTGGRKIQVIHQENANVGFAKAKSAHWDLTNFDQAEFMLVNSTGFVYEPAEWLLALSTSHPSCLWVMYNRFNEVCPVLTQHLVSIMRQTDPYDVPTTDPMSILWKGKAYRDAEAQAKYLRNVAWDGPGRTSGGAGKPEDSLRLVGEFIATYGSKVSDYVQAHSGQDIDTKVASQYEAYRKDRRKRSLSLPLQVLRALDALSSPVAFVFDNKKCPLANCLFQLDKPDPMALGVHYMTHAGLGGVTRMQCPGYAHQKCGHRINALTDVAFFLNQHAVPEAKWDDKRMAQVSGSRSAKHLWAQNTLKNREAATNWKRQYEEDLQRKRQYEAMTMTMLVPVGSARIHRRSKDVVVFSKSLSKSL
ncbi:hypothetical protein CF327_g734 [Tilletia walkeri]|nr:hypothetical protein CF327_g734 [Tilletia walkeri]